MNKTGKPQLQAWPWPLWKRDPGHRAMRMRHEWGHLQSCPLKLWGPRTGNQITSSSLVWWGWEDRGDEGSSKGREFLPLCGQGYSTRREEDIFPSHIKAMCGCKLKSNCLINLQSNLESSSLEITTISYEFIHSIHVYWASITGQATSQHTLTNNMEEKTCPMKFAF